MCLFVYIASTSGQLPCTPEHARAWDRFMTLEPCDEDRVHLEGVMEFSSVVVACAPPSGCGCGFYYETSAELADELEALADAPDDVRRGAVERRRIGADAVAALRAYLAAHCERGPLKVLAVWSNIKPPDGTQFVQPSFFGGDGFSFEEDHLYVVS